jgi:hypothetical protein
VIVAAAEAETAHKIAIRESLGTFIAEGNDLKRRCENPLAPVPRPEADSWKDRVEAYLEKELGHSYVVRFRDRTGIFQSESLMNGDNTHNGMCNGLYFFITRLEQFSQELPS